ncbi:MULTISPECIES: hypothetical protein [unclassified Streptomyces]|uniref:hypothetical protein n=1 Tax=unclassified Streptomyces TaxID=2593676 RepID=UPI000749BA41|nr:MULTISPECIES: hypothetical protein [unclassified Streptomyces]KUL58714.1 hypothetical protein ADL30_09615 [Streptomyces sp. NRRL S-1521]
MDRVEAELRAFEVAPAGLVRPGAFRRAIHTMAAPAVNRRAGVHPHLDVEFLQLGPHESLPALRSDDADAIRTTDLDGLPSGPGACPRPVGKSATTATGAGGAEGRLGPHQHGAVDAGEDRQRVVPC